MLKQVAKRISSSALILAVAFFGYFGTISPEGGFSLVAESNAWCQNIMLSNCLAVCYNLAESGYGQYEVSSCISSCYANYGDPQYCW